MHKRIPIVSIATKIMIPKTYKTFFLLETTRVSKSLEGLTSSLDQSAGDLWPLAKIAKVPFV